MATLTIHKLSDISNVASEFMNKYEQKRIVAFYGEMGVGKTTFIKALCKQLNVTDTMNSPSFAIVNEYHTSDHKLIYHIDLYRLTDPKELAEIGFEEYLHSGSVCFIEWPEIAENLLPNDSLKVQMRIDGDKRVVNIHD